MKRTDLAVFVKTIDVVDPDTGGDVQIEVYKSSGGGMLAIDASFLEQNFDDDVRIFIASPFDKGVQLELVDTPPRKSEGSKLKRAVAEAAKDAERTTNSIYIAKQFAVNNQPLAAIVLEPLEETARKTWNNLKVLETMV